MHEQETQDEPSRRWIAVMRHGKAEPAGRTDFERPLADRGRHDSADTGAWLAGQGFAPQLALVSAANRTVATWRSLAEGGGWDLAPTLSESLYAAGPDSALDLVREAPADTLAVILVGHNPTMASVASMLDDGDGDPEVSSELISGYPTSAVALFSYDGAWADLGEAGARLVGFHVGRGQAAG